MMRLLADLIRSERVAALGTLHQGAPLVSFTPYAVFPDLTDYLIHVSHLAQHTANMLQDGRVSLLIARRDSGLADPQTLPRVSIRGLAQALPEDAAGWAEARALYLDRFPSAKPRFALRDFRLFRITVQDARFVAGFGKAFDLTLDDFRLAARLPAFPTPDPSSGGREAAG